MQEERGGPQFVNKEKEIELKEAGRGREYDHDTLYKIPKELILKEPKIYPLKSLYLSF